MGYGSQDELVLKRHHDCHNTWLIDVYVVHNSLHKYFRTNRLQDSSIEKADSTDFGIVFERIDWPL